jgi:aldehyde:ferredoxin oxidoreductase
MGSKNLKGIAVRGTKGVFIENKKEMIKLSKRLINNLRASSGGQIRRKYGTMELVERINGAGFWVTRNFSEGHFDEGYKLEGAQMRENIVSGDSSCFGCPIGCGKWTYMKTEENKELHMEGPEFETVGMLGSNCGISSWKTIMEASKICDTYGFDTINAGGCIGMVMEAFEQGKLTLKDTDGIQMNFGNDQALLEILEKIGKREGLGNILAKGIMKAAKELGVGEFAVHVKGQTFPVYDPRGAKAMALTYATSPKGAHHMYATTFGAELGMGNRFEEKGKGLLERNHQFSMAIVDSIGICSTMRAGITLADQADAFSVINGIKMSVDDLNNAAERIINLERMYNVMIGYSRDNDTLPERFLTTPLIKGESKGQTVDLDFLLDDYYNEMGWNSKGIPSTEKLDDLELNEIFNF